MGVAQYPSQLSSGLRHVRFVFSCQPAASVVRPWQVSKLNQSHKLWQKKTWKYSTLNKVKGCVSQTDCIDYNIVGGWVF